MPPTCTICRHERKAEIDAALVAGEPFRIIAEQFGTSVGTLARHKEHLPVAVAQAQHAAEQARADTLLDQVTALKNKAIRLLMTAEAAGDLRTALMGVREARACIELLLEVEGRLSRAPVLNLHLSAEWVTIRAQVVAALAPYPDAAAAVVAVLLEEPHAEPRC